MLVNAHFYIIKISHVEDREIFKICLEYWAKFVEGLFEEAAQQNLSRHMIYHPVLSQLRVVMIERMVKPEEVKRLYRIDITHMLTHIIIRY